MSTSSEPQLDWSQAASLLGDDPINVSEDMAAIVVELIEGSEQQFKDLKVMKAETQRKEIGAKAHQLRGSLLNFGFVGVGVTLLEIEKGDYSADKYPALIEKADADFVASKKLFAGRYSKLGLS